MFYSNGISGIMQQLHLKTTQLSTKYHFFNNTAGETSEIAVNNLADRVFFYWKAWSEKVSSHSTYERGTDDV